MSFQSYSTLELDPEVSHLSLRRESSGGCREPEVRSAPDRFRAEAPQRSSPGGPEDRPRRLPMNPGETLTGRWSCGKPRAEVEKREGRKGKGRRKQKMQRK